MNILSLETSTRKFSIAVSARGVIKAQRSIVLKKVLSASIMPAIERILRQARVAFSFTVVVTLFNVGKMP